jgi:peptide/nickel transport system substrate-binding protein
LPAPRKKVHVGANKHHKDQVDMKRRTFLQATAAAAALPSSFAIAQPARARTLRFVPQANLTLLDPIFTTANVTANHGWAIYDTLFGVNAKNEVKPQMAEGFTVSDDGRTYLIKLREGLKFHNGEPVRAQDAAPSLARWSARDTLGQTLAKFVDSWGVQDDRTVKITLKSPMPILIEAIAKPDANCTFIMPEHLAKTDPFKQVTEAIGSGPLKFLKDEFVPGSSVAYARNNDYVPRQEPADGTSGGKMVHFDRVEWQIIPDAATSAAALQSGEIDWYEQVQADLVPLLRKNADIAIGSANPSGFNGVLRFNHLNAPFNNPAVRRAVLMAVNQNDYMAAVTGNDATAFRTCKALFPCGTTYGREIGAPAMGGDMDKAKAMLKASGYNGEKVVIINPTDFVSIGPLGDVTYDTLKRLGMNVEMVATDWGTVVQRRASKEPTEKGGWSIFHTWWPSGSINLPVISAIVRGQGNTGWFGWFSDEKIEKLTSDWLQAKTQAERDSIADAIQTEAFQSVPTVPLGQFQIRTAYRKNLTGLLEGTGAFFWNVKRA